MHVLQITKFNSCASVSHESDQGKISVSDKVIPCARVQHKSWRFLLEMNRLENTDLDDISDIRMLT